MKMEKIVSLRLMDFVDSFESSNDYDVYIARNDNKLCVAVRSFVLIFNISDCYNLSDLVNIIKWSDKDKISELDLDVLIYEKVNYYELPCHANFQGIYDVIHYVSLCEMVLHEMLSYHVEYDMHNGELHYLEELYKCNFKEVSERIRGYFL